MKKRKIYPNDCKCSPPVLKKNGVFETSILMYTVICKATKAKQYMVMCSTCKLETGLYDNPDDASVAWNNGNISRPKLRLVNGGLSDN